MRRITRATWLVLAGALLASVLSVAALVRVARQPRLATALPQATATPLLSVITPDGVVVVTVNGAYRVSQDLRVKPLPWNVFGKIVNIRSAAWANGELTLIASVERNGNPELTLLQVTRDRMITLPGRENLIGLVGHENGVTVYGESDGQVRRWELGSDVYRLGGPAVPGEALEGVVTVKGETFLLIGERGAHWLLDWHRGLHPLPEGAYSVWSASLLRPPLNSASRVPFLDENGRTHVFAPAGPPVLRVEAGGTLAPLPITHSLDEPGVIVSNAGDHRVEVRHASRRIWVSGDGRPSWRAVATSTLPCDFQAIPVGNRWLVLGDHGYEGVALDARLARLDAGEPMFVALTSQPRIVWMLLIGVLGLFAAAVPFAVRRTVVSLRVLDDKNGLILGVLKLPPGALGATGRDGRVNLAGDCQLRAGGKSYDLSSGPRRADSGPPLCDGDAVYVVGRVEADQSGGPWRASHRERIVADGGHYLIGRGDAADFMHQLAARANAQLLGFALAHLTLAISVLGFLGLRPFI